MIDVELKQFLDEQFAAFPRLLDAHFERARSLRMGQALPGSQLSIEARVASLEARVLRLEQEAMKETAHAIRLAPPR